MHGDVGARVDAWWTMWSAGDEAPRTSRLGAMAAADLRMRDRFSCVEGTDELTRHSGAVQRFMPGLRLQREGDARHCQAMVLADWTAAGPDGQARGPGTNVFMRAPDGC